MPGEIDPMVEFSMGVHVQSQHVCGRESAWHCGHLGSGDFDAMQSCDYNFHVPFEAHTCVEDFIAGLCKTPCPSVVVNIDEHVSWCNKCRSYTCTCSI